VTKESAVMLTVVAGGLIAMQAPINSMLGKSVGTFAAASVSFIVGTIALVLITLLVGGGFGDLGEARHLSWYYLMGGVLGAWLASGEPMSISYYRRRWTDRYDSVRRAA